MRRELVLPALVSLLLMVLLMARALTPDTPVRAVHLAVPTIAPAAQTQVGATAISADAASILARPLFSQSRRPTDAKPMAVAGHADPRLSAIFVTPGSRRAVFDDGGPKPIAVRAGDRAGPFEIVEIDPTRVVVTDASGHRRILRPTPKESSGSGDGQAAATADGTAPGDAGLSLLQQLQRNGAAHFGAPPAAGIQSLLERLQHSGRE